MILPRPRPSGKALPAQGCELALPPARGNITRNGGDVLGPDWKP
jgi:hypothetical protein